MSVLTFERKQDGELWSETELHTLLTHLESRPRIGRRPGMGNRRD